MSNINLDEMIITCEACGSVKHFHVKSQNDCDEILERFKCENNCGRSLLSYFTVGSLIRENGFSTSDDHVQLAIAN